MTTGAFKDRLCHSVVTVGSLFSLARVEVTVPGSLVHPGGRSHLTVYEPESCKAPDPAHPNNAGAERSACKSPPSERAPLQKAERVPECFQDQHVNVQ